MIEIVEIIIVIIPAVAVVSFTENDVRFLDKIIFLCKRITIIAVYLFYTHLKISINMIPIHFLFMHL